MLLPIRKILWPTDFSEPSYEALERAIELSEHFAAELLALHVVAPIPRIKPDYASGAEAEAYAVELKTYEELLQQAARQRLQDVCKRRVPEHMKPSIIVRSGDPACEIVRTAEDERVSLIVIATHGMAGWRPLLFGSVAERVMRLATCPVLTIRPPRAGR